LTGVLALGNALYLSSLSHPGIGRVPRPALKPAPHGATRR
jgi:hypothetical protein